jgi:pimeloyl-ACP methyl ester carboxylesterase
VIVRWGTLAVTSLLLLTGARRRRLVDGPISLAYLYRRHKGRAKVAAGEPWIFLHGLGGSAAVTWWHEFVRLRGESDLFAVDLSAAGGTLSPGGALTIPAAAEMIIRLLEHELAGRPATIVGLSLGGWIAVRIAMRRPDLVARLILVDAAGYRDQDWERIQSLVTLHNMADTDRLFAALYAHPPLLLRWTRHALYTAFTTEGVQTILRETAEADAYDRKDLERLTMPVELIWGEKDGLFRLEVAQAMQKVIPQARLQVLQGCGHAVHIDCPEKLADALQNIRERGLPPATTPQTPKSFPSVTPH